MEIKISELTLGVANKDAVVPVTNAAGTTTEKIKLGDIVSLGKTAVSLAYAATVNTDATSGDLFDLTLTGNVVLANPTGGFNGQTIRWRIRQDATGGRTVTFPVGTKFNIPSSATSPLPFSTAANKMDILAATYHAGRDKWDIVAFVMGY